jgi:hypothetical protein
MVMSYAFDDSRALFPLLDALKRSGVDVGVVDGGNSLPALNIKSGPHSILFRQAGPGLLERFGESGTADFCDLLSAVDGGNVEPLLVTGSRAGFVWVACAVRTEQDEWEGMLAECAGSKDIDTRYGLRMEQDEQQVYLRDLFSSFSSWLPERFPLRNVSHSNAVLVIRVNPDELWFLRLPLSVYACSDGYSLRQYRSVEYIVTGKSFAQYLRERSEINTALSDTRTLLRNVVIIINTYDLQQQVERAARGTEVLVEALQLFRNVTINREKLSLRWYLNPSHETISAILNDKTVAFLFADFESGDGRWEIGKGPRQSWDGKAQSTEISEQQSFFDFDGRPFDLSHVQLMRVYHCNAAYRPADAIADQRNPADGRSIVHQILVAGARRVEGGFTRESYFDFLESVIGLLLSPQLLFILEMQCWTNGKDCNELVGRLKEFVPEAS